MQSSTMLDRTGGGSVGGTKRSRVIGNIKSPKLNNPAAAAAAAAAQAARAATVSRRVARTCHNSECSKNPYFGWHGEKALFCVTHKEPGMVDVKNKRCEASGCMKRGLFGFDGERARFCGGHRLEGMVDLKNKRCKWVGCAKQATYATEGKSTACFCSEHRSPGMVDVKGRRCETSQCTKQAAYGMQNDKPRFCLLHRGSGMVDVRPRARTAGSGATLAPPGGTKVGVPVTLGSDGAKRNGNVNGHDHVEGVSSFAIKWGKRSRKNQDNAGEGGAGSPAAGVHGTGGEGERTAVGVSGANFTPGVAGSHADLLRPRRASSPPFVNQGGVWYPGSGFSPGIGVQANSAAPMRPWSLGRAQQLGGSMGSGVPSVGMWALTGNQIAAAASAASTTATATGGTAQWMPNSQDNAAAVSSGGGGGDASVNGNSNSTALQSPSAHWAAGEHDNNLVSTLVDDTSATYYTGPYESSMGALPLVARSCSSLPAHALGGSGVSSGRYFMGGGYIGGSSGGSNGSMQTDGSGREGSGGVEIGAGTGGGATDNWRSSTPGPTMFSEPFQHSAGMLSGIDAHAYGLLTLGADTTGTVPLGGGQNGRVEHSSVAGGGRGSSDGPVNRGLSPKVELVEGSDGPEEMVEDGWLRELMQGAIRSESGAMEMPTHTGSMGAEFSAAGNSAGNVRYPTPGLQKPLAAHPGTLQYSLGRQGGAASGEHPSIVRAGTGTPSSFQSLPQQHQQQHRQDEDSCSPSLSRALSSTHGTVAAACFAGSGETRSAYLSNGSNSSSNSSAGRSSGGGGGRATVVGTLVRSPSTASSGASPPDEPTASDTDCAIPRHDQSFRHSGDEGVGGGVGNPAGGGGGSPGIGGDGGNARAGSPGGGPSLHHLFMNLTAAGYSGGGQGIMVSDMTATAPPPSPSFSGGGLNGSAVSGRLERGLTEFRFDA